MVHFYTRTTLVLSSPLAARMFFPRVPPALLARIPPIQLIIKPEGYQPRSRREVRTQAAHRNLTIEQGRTACCKGNCLKDPIQMRVLGMPLDATRTEVLSHQPLGSYVEDTSIIKIPWNSFDTSFQAFAQHTIQATIPPYFPERRHPPQHCERAPQRENLPQLPRHHVRHGRRNRMPVFLTADQSFDDIPHLLTQRSIDGRDGVRGNQRRFIQCHAG